MTLADLPRFPCTHDKRPLTAHGFYDAQRDCDHSGWPLVGVRTGATSGIDVLDIDPSGMAWLAENEPRLPLTRRHRTQRGLHLLFVHAKDLRSSTGRIAQGVDVRAEGGFVIWWPREGFAVVNEDCVAEWPEWLLELATRREKHRVEKNLSTSLLPHPHHHERERVVDGLTEALRKLDPMRWNSKGQNGKYEEWLALMVACKFAGIARDVFVEWSIGDPDYADDGEVIARKWESFAQPKHAGALWAALKEAGIKVTTNHNHGGDGFESAEVLVGASLRKVRSLKPWLDAIQRSIRDEPSLFRGACTMAEIIGEGRLKIGVAVRLLESSARACGLWHELGADEVRRTVANGLRHVEEKILAMEKME
jgi:hypothetical protein